MTHQWALLNANGSPSAGRGSLLNSAGKLHKPSCYNQGSYVYYFLCTNYYLFSLVLIGSDYLRNLRTENRTEQRTERTRTEQNRTFGSVLSVPVLWISSELNFGNTRICIQQFIGNGTGVSAGFAGFFMFSM